MKYVGSKNRIAKEIIPFMLKDSAKYRCWLEPFVGGANLIDKIPSTFYRVGNDKNHYLITLLNKIKEDCSWIPSNITEQEYYKVKYNPKNYPDYLVGFVAFCCSFGSKYWGGYARGAGRNFCLEAKKNLIKQSKNLQDINFMSVDYKNLVIKQPSKTIVYCDPPYKNTTKYHAGINYDEFYHWLLVQHSKGCKIYVSEYWMPPEFVCIFKKKSNI